jgi:hypothetical protein
LSFKDLSLEHKADGDEKVDKMMTGGLKNINGWSIGSSFGDRAFYKGDWQT